MIRGERLRPLAGDWRRRRTMFSTSMMASSTRSPRAITKPARTMTLMVAPRAVQDQRRGHQRERDGDSADKRGAPLEQEERMTMTTRSAPKSRAPVRLSIDVWMKVAGRKIVVSISMPSRPGFELLECRPRRPRVTSSVLPQGNFSMMSIRPGPPLMTASPQSGW